MDIRFIKRLPIRDALFISYSILILVLTVIIGFIFTEISAKNVMDQVNKNTHAYLGEVNERIASLVAVTVDLGFYLSNDDDLKIQLRNYPTQDAVTQVEIESKIRSIIDSYLWDKPQIFNINVLAPGQKNVSNGRNSLYPLEDVQDRDWFQKLAGSNSVLLEDHLIDRNNLDLNLEKYDWYTITTLSRIKDNDKQDIGYLMVDMTKDYLYGQLDEKRTSVNSSIFVVNNTGEIVISKDNKMMNETLPINVDELMQSREGGFINMKYFGQSCLMVYTEANVQGWRIVEFIPISELYTGNRGRQISSVVIVLLLALLVAVPLASLLSGYVTRPIIALAAMMKRFSAGDVKERVVTDFTNEIGELHESYNILLDRITALLHDIVIANEEKRQMDLKILQAQINPHFLYNTLDSISWNALSQGMPEISEIISTFSKLFRLSLNNGWRACLLSDEIEQAHHYMDIEKLCFNNCFDYRFEYGSDMTSYYIPKLILQPLLENAIKYGFERTQKGGLLIIRIKSIDDKLIVEVEDNGKGMSDDQISKVLNTDIQRKGIGVKNVHERIQLSCGNGYGLSYAHAPLEGVLVIVTLPLVTDISVFDNL